MGIVRLTVSVPAELAELLDALARDRGLTRSAMVARLLEREARERLAHEMAEGYRETAGGNRREVAKLLSAQSEVILSDDRPR